MAGRERVIWRCDPILINERYTEEYHLRAFAEIAEKLRNHTEKAVISFIDFYAKTKRGTKDLHIRKLSGEEMTELAGKLARIAAKNGLKIESCADEINLEAADVPHGSCIDQALLEGIAGCRYCCANFSGERVREYRARYDAASALVER